MTQTDSRIVSLDVLRGVALLGILLMNIQSFAMIEAAYFNPTAFGDLAGANYWVWYGSRLFADSKFMTIFSMLFGASMLLISDGATAKELNPWHVHLRRNLFLLFVGLGHAYLLWYGDILLPYAVCSFVVFWFRQRSPTAQAISGLCFLLIGSALSALGAMQPDSPALQAEIAAFSPDAAAIASELDAYRGTWSEQMSYRVEAALGMHLVVFPFYFFWRVSGMMLLGMALYRWGVLSSVKSTRFYAVMLVLGWGAGLPIVHQGVVISQNSGWDYLISFFVASPFNYWGSLLVALGWIALVMMLCRFSGLRSLKNALANVGRMAFSNYLLQTLIATTLFYGHGLGRFGYMSRVEQLDVVLAVWVLQLILSTAWLARCHYGPAEWLWRWVVTGSKPQFMRN